MRGSLFIVIIGQRRAVVNQKLLLTVSAPFFHQVNNQAWCARSRVALRLFAPLCLPLEGIVPFTGRRCPSSQTGADEVEAAAFDQPRTGRGGDTSSVIQLAGDAG